jgi:hypothetical protein
MSSPRKSAADKNFQTRTQEAKKRQAKRAMRVEQLEDRRLMAVAPINGMYYPPIGKFTADFSPSVPRELYAQRSAIQFGSGLGGGPAANGESGSAFSATEIEPNNIPTQGQLLPLGTGAGQSQTVTVTGQLPLVNGVRDVDYFAFDAVAGDVITVKLNSAATGIPFDVSIVTAGDSPIIGSTLNQLGGISPPTSPLSDTTSPVAFAKVIPTTGRYYVRVSDGTQTYSLRLEARRPSIEAEPIGTRQIVFVDFDGATISPGTFGLPVTTRIPSMIDTLVGFGFTPQDENALIDGVMAVIHNRFNTQLSAFGANGYYRQDGVPGAFDIEFRNSRDHADPWGLPNVSRLIVGGDEFDLGIPTRGIAESVDIGNFDREETGIVLPGVMFPEIVAIPRAPGLSLLSAMAAGLGQTGSHEIGHFIGARHQFNGNNVRTLMDSGGQEYGVSRLGTGVDGIWGTADDIDIGFGRDRYAIVEGLIGTVDHRATMAFGLSTGKVGNLITGNVYNDINRNAQRNLNEAGIAGWEVFVDANGNGLREFGEAKGTTDASGNYRITVAPGTYNVRVTRPAGWIASTDTEIVKSVDARTGNAVANFGSVQPNNTVTGFKWLDINADGIRDNNEPGLAGVYIFLDLDLDGRPDIGEPSAISGADGSYSLTPPSAGTYVIREVVDAGFRQTFPVGADGLSVDSAGRPVGHTAVYNGSTPLIGFNFGNAEFADFGDAPAPYATTRAQNGASHGFLNGLRLGSLWDADQDGRPTVNADGDDLNNSDDEDGIQALTTFVRGDSSNNMRLIVNNTTGSLAYVHGWMDFNGDGDWNDAGELVVSALQVPSGATTFSQDIMFTVPATAANRVYARFRLSQQATLTPSGRAGVGEVEDYSFTVVDGPRRNLQPDTFTVNRNSINQPLDVIANDFAPQGVTWTITGVTSTLQGGRALIDTANNRILYSPPLSFIGVDEFTYTARSSTGVVDTARVTINILARFADPLAVDDSFDIPTNSIGFPLNVLANDIEGQGGALVITSITTPNRGGTVTIGTGGQSIRYTPVRGFGGTETFTYTATDGTGKVTTSNVTIHTLEGARNDDIVEFSFRFLDLAGNAITRIQQGQQFRVEVYVDDLRPERGQAQVPPVLVNQPGVYSAYLDMLYSAGLVAPVSPASGGGLDFNVTFGDDYPAGRTGSAQTPGVINELGAFAGRITTMNEEDPLLLASMLFTANSAGLAEFISDPSDLRPQSDVTVFNRPSTAVPVDEIRYGRARLEIVPSGTNFPIAKDDSPVLVAGVNIPMVPAGRPSTIDVLANDIIGSNGPIRITSTRMTSSNGQVVIIDNGAQVQYIPNTNFIGTDQFEYTITDQRGFTSTATVTLNVGNFNQVTADDQVELRLQVTDMNGNPITQVAPGQQFQLRGFVKDLRESQNPQPTRPGVFAAYQDILFNSNLVTANANLAPFFDNNFSGSVYRQGKAGDVFVPGLINELGSFQDDRSSPLGFPERLQWIINFTAGTALGTATFVGDPADVKPFHDTLLFDPTTPLLPNQVRYSVASVQIALAGGGGGTGGGGAGGGGNQDGGFTNWGNNYDVNADGFVSPIDVLIIINSINSGAGGQLPPGGGEGEAGEKYYVDVNADGFVDPLDVLAVINFLNSTGSMGGEGEGEGSSDGLVLRSGELPLVDLPFSGTSIGSKSIYEDISLYGGTTDEDDSETDLSNMLYCIVEEEDDEYLDSLAANLLAQ